MAQDRKASAGYVPPRIDTLATDEIVRLLGPAQGYLAAEGGIDLRPGPTDGNLGVKGR